MVTIREFRGVIYSFRLSETVIILGEAPVCLLFMTALIRGSLQKTTTGINRGTRGLIGPIQTGYCGQRGRAADVWINVILYYLVIFFRECYE